jgi:glycerol-3-phosphate acyltransferase PlsX
VRAARELGLEVTLVGREDELRAALGRRGRKLPIEIIHASEVIKMAEHPANAVRRKKDSSIVVGMRLVRAGEAAAFVSAGNTGAMLAAALLVLGRVRGYDRPAIGSWIPTPRGRTLLVDAGANADVRPQHLVGFARMGAAYLQTSGVERPAVGLLSNGEEPTKGNALTLEAHALLSESGLEFRGNVEGRDIPRGAVDVVVADGFTGNVALKAMEGAVELLLGIVREEVTRGLRSKLAALALRPAFRRVRARLDPNEEGGSPLLGANGVVFIAHGSSNALAIKNALRVASEAARADLVGAVARSAARPDPETDSPEATGA